MSTNNQPGYWFIVLWQDKVSWGKSGNLFFYQKFKKNGLFKIQIVGNQIIKKQIGGKNINII